MKISGVKTVNKNGVDVRMLVIRPECPKLAVQFVDLINRLKNNGELNDSQHSKAFQEMLSLQHYVVVGFCGDKEPCIVRICIEGQEHLEGEVIGRLQPGDSFVDEDDFAKWRNLSAELRESVVIQ